MAIVYSVLKIIGILSLIVMIFVMALGLLQMIRVILKTTLYRRKSNLPVLKNITYIKHVKYKLMRKKFIFPVELVKWIMIDIIRGKVRIKLYGIWCFTGYFGEGKTLGCVMYALKLRKELEKIGYYVHIYTNFNMRYQDGKITTWEDLLNLPPRTIVIFDEIQSTFTSQKFKEFPLELLWKITQCRKQELCIFASSPVFNRMTIQLRENTDMVVCCNNVLKLDRWFNYKFYHADEYEKAQGSMFGMFRKCIRSLNVIAQDVDYQAYDTKQIVDRLDIETPDKQIKKDLVKLRDYVREVANKEIRKIVEEYVDERLKKIA